VSHNPARSSSDNISSEPSDIHHNSMLSSGGEGRELHLVLLLLIGISEEVVRS